MSEGTVTLEFYVSDSGRSGIAQVCGAELEGVIHARQAIADHLDPLPLCWVAEGKGREVPATVEDWEVSFDHETLPSYSVVDVGAFVTCSECREWMHA